MAESDDENEFGKRRDKFRVERRGVYETGGGSSSPRRDGFRDGSRREWAPTSGRGGRYYENGGNSSTVSYRRERQFSPRKHDMSPPGKRMRTDWDDFRVYGSGGGGGSSYEGSYHGIDSGDRRGFMSRNVSTPNVSVGVDSDLFQPPIMSFKAFLGTQDDTITDEEALKKYGEYKLEFKRQQLNEFFVNHKEEEWFKLRYHPEDSLKRISGLKDYLLRRLEVFNKFYTQSKFDDVTIDVDQTEKLIKIMDSVAVLLEGGDENDLKILDNVETSAHVENSSKLDAGTSELSTAASEVVLGEITKESEVNKDLMMSGEQMSSAHSDFDKEVKRYPEIEAPSATDVLPKASAGGINGKKKRKRSTFDDDGLSDCNSSSDDDQDPLGNDEAHKDDGMSKDELTNIEPVEKEGLKENEATINDDIDQPRALHKTVSVFLRNLAPSITKAEVEAVCRRYPGFLRVAIAEPLAERRWFRRGWATFERSTKIKDVCFKLNNIRLREFELGTIINRDLTRRIRTVPGITVDRKVVRNDIKLAAKVITNLDKRWDLWQCSEDQMTSKVIAEEESDVFGINMSQSKNPVLKNITDYLIEEASAEEEELLGRHNSELEDGEEGEEGNNIVRDAELISVLDRLLFYLRIVHSVDFYNHSEYPNEDEMPNKCGIIHARSAAPTTPVLPGEIEEYMVTFEKKMGSFLSPKAELTEEEAAKLGIKNEEEEVEKFVQANTQELSKDKWLCPLSGKKFRGPDFVKKHILNKHAEKVDEVKKEVTFYNNYLKDPKRPHLPENPLNKGFRNAVGANKTAASGLDYHSAPHKEVNYMREATAYPVYDSMSDRRRGGYNDPGYYGRPYRRFYDSYGSGRGVRMRDRGGGRGLRASPHNFVKDPRAIIDYADFDSSVNVSDLF